MERVISIVQSDQTLNDTSLHEADACKEHLPTYCRRPPLWLVSHRFCFVPRPTYRRGSLEAVGIEVERVPIPGREAMVNMVLYELLVKDETPQSFAFGYNHSAHADGESYPVILATSCGRPEEVNDQYPRVAICWRITYIDAISARLA